MLFKTDQKKSTPSLAKNQENYEQTADWNDMLCSSNSVLFIT